MEWIDELGIDARGMTQAEYARARHDRLACEHHPNVNGTACEHCGLPALPVMADELVLAMAEAYAEAHRRAELRAIGQTEWTDAQ